MQANVVKGNVQLAKRYAGHKDAHKLYVIQPQMECLPSKESQNPRRQSGFLTSQMIMLSSLNHEHR